MANGIALSFRRQALAYPEQARKACELVTSVSDGVKVLRAGDALLSMLKDFDADTEAVNAIHTGRLYAQAKIGELLPAKTRKETGALKGKKGAVPSTLPFSSHTLTRFRKVAKGRDLIEAYREATVGGDSGPVEMCTKDFIVFVATGKIPDAKGAHVANNSGQVEWYTPKEYVDAARNVMGAIDLDPASSRVAQKTVKATTFYTAKDDGLSKRWAGKVWMNPPYSSALVGKFTGKLAEHVEAGEVRQAIVLVNNATDSMWFQSLAAISTAICFPKGRIRFSDAEGNPSGSPLQGQAFIYIGHNTTAFLKHFSVYGVVLNAAS